MTALACIDPAPMTTRLSNFMPSTASCLHHKLRSVAKQNKLGSPISCQRFNFELDGRRSMTQNMASNLTYCTISKPKEQFRFAFNFNAKIWYRKIKTRADEWITKIGIFSRERRTLLDLRAGNQISFLLAGWREIDFVWFLQSLALIFCRNFSIAADQINEQLFLSKFLHRMSRNSRKSKPNYKHWYHFHSQPASP